MDVIYSLKSLIRTISIFDVCDIVVVTFLIYNLIKIVRESRAGQLVKGIIVVLCAYFLASQLHFRMFSAVLNTLFQFSIYGFFVVFQPELRKILEQIGRSKITGILPFINISSDEDSYIKQCNNMSKIITDSVISLSISKTGALIVFERKTKLGEIIDTGVLIKSLPSSALICNIFFNKAPLHDGALIVKNWLLYAGGCILPLTKSSEINVDLGTRHRAAIGISESSDAVAVVVSEETGNVSIAINGILKTYRNMETFKNELEELLLDRRETVKPKKILSYIKKVK